MPLIDENKALRLESLSARAQTLDRKFLSNFLIDCSWGSSVLEGGTYSSLDTEALIEYGQKNPDKPTEDAALVLNHKSAIEFLWGHRELSSDVICELQSRLTDRHGLKEIEDSDHFLPDAQRGHPRDTEDLNINRSAYIPPFRPGTGYIAASFSRLIAVANTLPPVQSAFYLMTRIPYLQVFANGNKRTARLAANIPLLAAGLLPISFVDINKADYIQAMAAFYELGNIQLMEKMFIEGYVQSIVRGSGLTPLERVRQTDPQQLKADLVSYVQSGKFPSGIAKTFIKTPLSATSSTKPHFLPFVAQ
jgi:Fic family protein